LCVEKVKKYLISEVNVQEISERLVFDLLPKIATPLLVIVLAYVLAQGTWLLVSPEKYSHMLYGMVNEKQNSYFKKNNIFSIYDLEKLALFGKENIDPHIVKTELSTTVKLKLTGISIADNNQKNAMAIIKDADTKEKIYKVGDRLENNMVLYEIYNDHVILSQNNKHSVLYLYESKEKRRF